MTQQETTSGIVLAFSSSTDSLGGKKLSRGAHSDTLVLHALFRGKNTRDLGTRLASLCPCCQDYDRADDKSSLRRPCPFTPSGALRGHSPSWPSDLTVQAYWNFREQRTQHLQRVYGLLLAWALSEILITHRADQKKQKTTQGSPPAPAVCPLCSAQKSSLFSILYSS